MKTYNAGVLEPSNIYFHTCGSVAKDLFFYLLCTGKYTCDNTYVVNRNGYDSFLIMYVIKGKGFVRINDTDVPLNKNEFAFIDCYEKHYYYTKSGWEIIWIHFDGSLARNYYEHIIGQSGNIIKLKNALPAKYSIEKIHSTFAKKKSPSDPLLSKEITNMLTEFILSAAPISKAKKNSYIIDDIVAYISDNFARNLTLSELAERAFFSPYYFTRLFKKETGYTPHKYIILARVNSAKFYLKTTDSSIKNIAFTCGFSNESSFCTTFKRMTGFSPSTYRHNTEN